jgi:hypothetical protein
MLRPGNAGSNTATNHVAVIREAIRQLPLPAGGKVGRRVLIRIDGAGVTHEVVDYIVARRAGCSRDRPTADRDSGGAAQRLARARGVPSRA